MSEKEMPRVALRAISDIYSRTAQLGLGTCPTESHARDLVTCVFPVIDETLHSLQNQLSPLSFSLAPNVGSSVATASSIQVVSDFLRWQESVVINQASLHWEVSEESLERCRESILMIYKGLCLRPRMYFATLIGAGCFAMTSIEELVTQCADGKRPMLLSLHLQKLGLTDSQFCQIGCLQVDSDQFGTAPYWRAIWRSYLMCHLPASFEKWLLEMTEVSSG